MSYHKLQKLYNLILSGLLVAGFTFLNISNSNAAALSNNMNIAVVDAVSFQQAFMAEVNERVQNEFTSKQQEVQKLVDQLKSEQEKYQKNRPVMSEDSLKKLEATLVEKQTALQNKAMQYDQEFKQRQQEELKVRSDILMKVVNEISSTKKYDVVLAKNVFLFVNDKFDITDVVKKQYDAEYKDYLSKAKKK